MEKSFKTMHGKMEDLNSNLSLMRGDLRENTEGLNELNINIQELKSHTEMFFQSFEGHFDDLEEYLKKKLGSDYEKLKMYISDYRSGNISAWQLVKKGIKTIGKRFALIIKKRNPNYMTMKLNNSKVKNSQLNPNQL